MLSDHHLSEKIDDDDDSSADGGGNALPIALVVLLLLVSSRPAHGVTTPLDAGVVASAIPKFCPE